MSFPRLPIKTKEWASVLLLWAMLLIATFGILQAELIGGLYILPLVATLALFTGIVLAKSVFSPRIAHPLALMVGLFSVLMLVGATLPATVPWGERMIDLVTRQYAWLQAAASGGVSRDGLVFVIQLAAIFWMLGYFAAWYTYRKPRVWPVVLPAGIVLLSVIYYYYGPRPLELYLALYVFLALLFVASTHLRARLRLGNGFDS